MDGTAVAAAEEEEEARGGGGRQHLGHFGEQRRISELVPHRQAPGRERGVSGEDEAGDGLCQYGGQQAEDAVVADAGALHRIPALPADW